MAAPALAQGLTAVANYFVMDWAAIWKDIFGGLLIAGALAAWVPNSFWESFLYGLAAVLVWRFVRTGGLPMLRMMNKPMGEHA